MIHEIATFELKFDPDTFQFVFPSLPFRLAIRVASRDTFHNEA